MYSRNMSSEAEDNTHMDGEVARRMKMNTCLESACEDV